MTRANSFEAANFSFSVRRSETKRIHGWSSLSSASQNAKFAFTHVCIRNKLLWQQRRNEDVWERARARFAFVLATQFVNNHRFISFTNGSLWWQTKVYTSHRIYCRLTLSVICHCYLLIANIHTDKSMHYVKQTASCVRCHARHYQVIEKINIIQVKNDAGNQNGDFTWTAIREKEKKHRTQKCLYGKQFRTNNASHFVVILI